MVPASHLLAAGIALAAASTNAFSSSLLAHQRHASGGVPVVGPLYAMDSAQALSEYMAKSHEDKLKAIKAVEDSKNLEIEALKAEIRQLKGGAPAAAAPVAIANDATSSSDAESKLASYQAFMSEYIVNSQNQKLLAVKEAERKAEKKFEEQLEQSLKARVVELPLPEGGAAASSVAVKEVVKEKPIVVEEISVAVKEKPAAAKKSGAPAVASAPPATPSSPSLRDLAAGASASFQSRNAYIIRAAAAGKSRWGTMEIDQAKKDLQRAASAPAAAPSHEAAGVASPYAERNEQVVAAAGAGKSRWGNMEVDRLKKNRAATETAAVAKEENKGAGVSLEDRVNLGARLLEGAQKFMNGSQ